MKSRFLLTLCLIVLYSGCAVDLNDKADSEFQTKEIPMQISEESPSSQIEKGPYLSDDELHMRLSALKNDEQTIITSGDTRYYVSQTEYKRYPNATGTISRKNIDRLTADIQKSDGASLNDLLKPYGLSDERWGHITVDSEPTDEMEEFHSELVSYENDSILAINITSGWQHSGNDITHMLFSQSEDRYEFRGIIHTVHEQFHIPNKANEAADQILRCGNTLYYKCLNDVTTGTGEIESQTSYGCLTNSEPILTYHDYHYQNGTGGNGYGLVTTITPIAFETLADYRVNLTLQLNLYYEPFENNNILEVYTVSSYQLVLYNDCDGKGFYSYDDETLNFFRKPESVAFIRESLLPRLEMIAQSSNAELRNIAAAIIREPGFNH